MAIAKVKVFKSTDHAEIERDINRWLASLSARTEVRRSETAIVGLPTDNDPRSVAIVISVWYFDASN